MILISHIRQFMFCPRIFYFYNFCNISPVYPKHVEFGVDFHEKQNELFKKRSFAKFGINFKEIHKNLYLQNDEFGGILDMVLVCDDEIIVAEFKDQTNLNLNKGTKMQLIAYAKLASNHFKLPFHRVILCSGNNLKFKIYNIANVDLIEFDKTIKNINLLLQNEIFPDSSANLNACRQCEFLNYCDDRE